MFSIIVPLFNKCQYIEKSVLSVLSQTYSLFELIIINDGSTDESRQVVARFNDRRITIIDQTNKGVSMARNRGVEQARFEYVAFLDADDWWEPTFLEEMARLIQNYNEADLFGSNYYYVKHGQYRLESKGLPSEFRAGYIDYVSVYGSTFCVLLNCSFVVVSKQAFVRVGGFRQNLRFGEDFDVWIRLALIGKIAYVNIPLAYSNQDVASQNRAIGGYKLYQPEAHFIFNLAYLRETEQQSTALKSLLDGLRVRVLLPYYLAGKYIPEVQAILAEVDFSKQTPYYQRAYQLPTVLVRLYFELMRVGSYCKRVLGQLRLQIISINT